jgi:hypothetical protein
MSDEDKLKAAKLMYGNGAEAAVKLLNKALGDTEAPVGEAIDQRKAEEIVKNAIQHLLNRVDDKKITPTQAHTDLDDDLDGMIEDGYNIASDPKFRDLAHKMLEEFMQRMMAREDASPDEEDEFHKKLDKLVHKTFGHSSDEKKKKKEKEVDEIFGTKTDNASIKEQDPNKLKVLDWIAARTDGQEHFLSFYRKGAAWSGKLIFIKPDQAKAFMQKVENNSDYLPQIKQALTSMVTASKLFDRMGIKYQVRNAD